LRERPAAAGYASSANGAGASSFTLLLEDVPNLGLDCPLVVGRQRADYRREFTSGRIRIQRDRIVSDDPTFALQQPFEVDAVLIAETRDLLLL
jgi:hypothetical protein